MAISRLHTFQVLAAAAGCVVTILATTFANPASSAQPGLSGALANFPGRWTGEGRLGFKDGKVETVTCRATYFATKEAPGLKQSIRCASPSGKIELKSALSEQNGLLSGIWSEEIYNLSGELSGKVTDRGLVVKVKGQNLDANMDVIVKDNLQIVEIQFHNTSLVGITLLLKRSVAGGES